jgi:hypothetical protein
MIVTDGAGEIDVDDPAPLNGEDCTMTCESGLEFDPVEFVCKEADCGTGCINDGELGCIPIDSDYYISQCYLSDYTVAQLQSGAVCLAEAPGGSDDNAGASICEQNVRAILPLLTNAGSLETNMRQVLEASGDVMRLASCSKVDADDVEYYQDIANEILDHIIKLEDNVSDILDVSIQFLTDMLEKIDYGCNASGIQPESETLITIYLQAQNASNNKFVTAQYTVTPKDSDTPEQFDSDGAGIVQLTLPAGEYTIAIQPASDETLRALPTVRDLIITEDSEFYISGNKECGEVGEPSVVLLEA